MQQDEPNSDGGPWPVFAQDIAARNGKIEVGKCQRHLADDLGVFGTTTDKDGELPAGKAPGSGNRPAEIACDDRPFRGSSQSGPDFGREVGLESIEGTVLTLRDAEVRDRLWRSGGREKRSAAVLVPQDEGRLDVHTWVSLRLLRTQRINAENRATDAINEKAGTGSCDSNVAVIELDVEVDGTSAHVDHDGGVAGSWSC